MRAVKSEGETTIRNAARRIAEKSGRACSQRTRQALGRERAEAAICTRPEPRNLGDRAAITGDSLQSDEFFRATPKSA
jgi:hypothetical protein